LILRDYAIIIIAITPLFRHCHAIISFRQLFSGHSAAITPYSWPLMPLR
jgi:hypothetical protein